MYWPVGTPRVYAATTITTTQASAESTPASNYFLSHDGASLGNDANGETGDDGVPAHYRSLQGLDTTASKGQEQDEKGTTNLDIPFTPGLKTPLTPAVNSVEHDQFQLHDEHGSSSLGDATTGGAGAVPSGEPVLALRVSRTGHIFAVITPTTMSIWQTKPTVVQAVVVRSKASIKSYGTNVALLIRPDSVIFVLQTSLGYLITYSLATDTESRVYKPHFSDHTNIQRRRQSHFGGPGNSAPDQILLGPGEGLGVRDVSVRFRRVIKVDAGIECALALDDELVVATQKPAAVQCIRWTPDSSGSQTSTELVSRMGWLDKKVSIKEMTNDRPMNLSTWVTSDGKAYAVQRTSTIRANGNADIDPKRLYKGYCFHSPVAEPNRAVTAVINARFSLIAVGCADGTIHVYSVKDYAGNIPPSHVHNNPVTPATSGSLMTLSYSPDGYCLFAGYGNGWATWSVFGKSASQSFSADPALTAVNNETWLAGIIDASWLGGACEILLVSHQSDAIWSLEMARSAVTGCYSPPNLFRTVLQSSTSIMVYRGYELPDLTTDACTRRPDDSFRGGVFAGLHSSNHFSVEAEEGSLRNSLWVFEGNELRLWPDVQDVLHAASGDSTKELPPTVSIPVDFYPLSILLGKGIVLGVEPDLVQRRDVNFSYFRFSIRTHLFVAEILQSYLKRNSTSAALKLAQQYSDLEYFAHGLEILLHHVLDEEVDSAPRPEDAVLPRVLWLLSSFKQYLDIVVQCTRKTEVRSWRTLFAYLPPPQELFEESLQRGSLKTAGGYLLVLHTFEEIGAASEQSVRLFSRAIKEHDWELCKELARFLAAMDESGETLREALELVNIRVRKDSQDTGIMTRLGIPGRRGNAGAARLGQGSDTGSEAQSASDTSSFGAASPS
ncbi:hypothetical protein DL771_008842 [Monosporascus sp. 5C6A]|nr:hypothetical protein DL771_008842 [Monosporascus sp. 5C6A]